MHSPASALSPATVSTRTIVAGAAGVADASDNDHSANVTSSFTAVVAAPAVLAISPANSASGVDVAVTIWVRFNQPLNPASINSSTIQLGSNTGNRAIDLCYDRATSSATIAPREPLTDSTTYTVTVVGGPDGVSNGQGGTLANSFTSFFTTAAPRDPGPFSIESNPSVPAKVDNPERHHMKLGLEFQRANSTLEPAAVPLIPANSASAVDNTAPIDVQFNEPMDSTTINTNNVKCSSDAGNRVIAVSYDEATNSPTIAASGPLTDSTTYPVQVVGGADGVSDTNGETLASNVSSSAKAAARQDPRPSPIASNVNVPDCIDNSERRRTKLSLEPQSASYEDIDKTLPDAGSQSVSLRTADGNLLAVVTSTSATDSGWHDIDFAQPDMIRANQVDVAVLQAPSGYDSDSPSSFSGDSQVAGPQAALAGADPNASGSNFTSDFTQGSNDWDDLVLTSLVDAMLPTADETGVPTVTTVTFKAARYDR